MYSRDNSKGKLRGCSRHRHLGVFSRACGKQGSEFCPCSRPQLEPVFKTPMNIRQGGSSLCCKQQQQKTRGCLEAGWRSCTAVSQRPSCTPARRGGGREHLPPTSPQRQNPKPLWKAPLLLLRGWRKGREPSPCSCVQRAAIEARCLLHQLFEGDFRVPHSPLHAHAVPPDTTQPSFSLPSPATHQHPRQRNVPVGKQKIIRLQPSDSAATDGSRLLTGTGYKR